MAANTSGEVQYDHINDSRVADLIAVFVVSLFLAYTAVFLRLWSRHLIKASCKADDWIIVCSLIPTTGYIAGSFVNVRHGLGRHQVLVTQEIAFAKGVLVGEIIYTFAIASFKISTLFLYYRLFPGRNFKLALMGVGAFVFAYSITQAFCVLFECTPVSAAWSPTVNMQCIDIDDVFLVCSSFNIVTDFVILGIPMPKLWQLKVSRTQKIQLTTIFALGGFVCGISIVRITTIKQVYRADTSYSAVNGTLWSALEIGIGTASSCLPTLRPLYHRFFGRRHLNPARVSIETYQQAGCRDIIPSNTYGFARLKENKEEESSLSLFIPLEKVHVNNTPRRST